MKISVLVFPGTNCDHDAEHLFRSVMDHTVNRVWHRSEDLMNPDMVILPGGFAYGDYLRTGALAKISPVMKKVKEFAQKGGPVLGICNGFQILCETGLLPGVLLQNAHMKFISQFVHMKIENTKTAFTKNLEKGTVVTCPIAHFEGNYFADNDTLKKLEENNQVVFRYCNEAGVVNASDKTSNVNGAANAIAGICNEQGNVVGLMPHPERAVEALVGNHAGNSGFQLFSGLAA